MLWRLIMIMYLVHYSNWKDNRQWSIRILTKYEMKEFVYMGNIDRSRGTHIFQTQNQVKHDECKWNGILIRLTEPIWCKTLLINAIERGRILQQWNRRGFHSCWGESRKKIPWMIDARRYCTCIRLWTVSRHFWKHISSYIFRSTLWSNPRQEECIHIVFCLMALKSTLRDPVLISSLPLCPIRFYDDPHGWKDEWDLRQETTARDTLLYHVDHEWERKEEMKGDHWIYSHLYFTVNKYVSCSWNGPILTIFCERVILLIYEVGD